MQFDIITIFPKIFNSYFNEGIIKRALSLKKKIKIRTHNLRDFTDDKHKTVDGRPYGGGAGMVLMPEPLIKALGKVLGRSGALRGNAARTSSRAKKKTAVILFSAKGKRYDQAIARRLAACERIIMVCGRYEGVDERVRNFVDEEISVGDFVLTGGELAAMIIVDSVTRLLPDVLGCGESVNDESHSEPGVLEYPHFTRPAELALTPAQKRLQRASKSARVPWRVPEVLLSGHHAKVEEWRQSRRPKRG